jgi:formylglycine-generating enzyme required for sulfatase activity
MALALNVVRDLRLSLRTWFFIAWVVLFPAVGLAQAPSGTVRVNPRDGMNYVWIPAGTFMMGCSPEDSECMGQEKPAHQVTISKGFWIGQTEVTVKAFRGYVELSGAPLPTGQKSDQHPVVYVDWASAAGYCRWAGGRLPTEAEWEYAARGGSAAARYAPVEEIAWNSGNSGGQWHRVGQRRANSFGLFDMLGNVWQWVDDRYDANYYRNSPAVDPPGPASGSMRVLRGGSWGCALSCVRASSRGGREPGTRYSGIGFRCAAEVVAP